MAVLNFLSTRRRKKAEQARTEAREAYLDALDRGDTRDQRKTHERFVAATAECLRLGA